MYELLFLAEQTFPIKRPEIPESRGLPRNALLGARWLNALSINC